MAGLNQIRGSSQIMPGTVPATAMDTAFTASDGDIFVDKENHTAETNGNTTQFVLGHMPVVGSEHVFLRGTLRLDGYTLSGQTIQFDVAPGISGATMVTHDDLAISYRKLIA